YSVRHARRLLRPRAAVNLGSEPGIFEQRAAPLGAPALHGITQPAMRPHLRPAIELAEIDQDAILGKAAVAGGAAGEGVQHGEPAAVQVDLEQRPVTERRAAPERGGVPYRTPLVLSKLRGAYGQ